MVIAVTATSTIIGIISVTLILLSIILFVVSFMIIIAILTKPLALQAELLATPFGQPGARKSCLLCKVSVVTRTNDNDDSILGCAFDWTPGQQSAVVNRCCNVATCSSGGISDATANPVKGM